MSLLLSVYCRASSFSFTTVSQHLIHSQYRAGCYDVVNEDTGVVERGQVQSRMCLCVVPGPLLQSHLGQVSTLGVLTSLSVKEKSKESRLMLQRIMVGIKWVNKYKVACYYHGAAELLSPPFKDMGFLVWGYHGSTPVPALLRCFTCQNSMSSSSELPLWSLSLGPCFPSGVCSRGCENECLLPILGTPLLSLMQL